MYRLFLDSLGYPKDLDLAELEIGLETEHRLDRFQSAFEEVTGGRQWDERKGVVAFALSEASAAMRAIDPKIYADNDSWADANKGKADITPRLLATRVSELMEKRKPGHNVMFVVDEVGQFVARDVNKMLDLQAIVQQLGIHGHGKHWLAVTSQEKLGELVGGLDDTRIELARLMDRFQVAGPSRAIGYLGGDEQACTRKERVSTRANSAPFTMPTAASSLITRG